MKSTPNKSLPAAADQNILAKAVTNVETGAATNPLTARFKGLVQTAKGKWNALGKGEAEALAQGPGVVVSPEAERLAADAAVSAPSNLTPVADASVQASATIEAPIYDQLSGTLQGLVSPSDISALVQDAPVSSATSVSASGLSTFANPMDMGPADMVLGQAPATGAGSAAGGAGSAAGAGGAASGAAAGTAAGAGAATAGAAAGAGAVAAGAGVAVSGGALLAGVVGVAAIGSAAAAKSSDATTASTNTGTATSLIVADGYIEGAKVYIDMNDNGEIDSADVLFGTTGADGTVNGFLSDAQAVHGLLTSGGTDISTNLAFEGSYSATAGSKVVNPLTSLVQNMVLTTAGAQGSLSAADYLVKVKEAKASAITSVNSALGLATDADLTQIDTVSNAQSTASTTAAGITREQAIEMNSKAMMVANMMSLGAAAMKGSVTDSGTGSNTMAKLSNYMVQGIVGSINTAAASGGSVALGNSDSLKTILNTASDNAKTNTNFAFDDTKLTTAASTAATAVSSTNSAIDTITGNAKTASATTAGASSSLTQILQAQKAALSQIDNFKTGDSTKLTTISTNFADASGAFTQALSQTGLKLGTTAITADKLTTTAPTDTVVPTVTAITATPARAGDIAKFEVKMSEGVIVKFASDAYKPTLTIKTGDTTTGTALFDPGLSTGDKLVFTYQVKTTDTTLSIAAGTSIVLPTNPDATKPTVIKDFANNPATLTLATALATFTAPTVDGNAPDIKVTVADAFVKAGASTTVTFEVSEKVATAAAGAFTIDDISVREAGVLKTGRVSNFKQLTTAEVAADKSLDPSKFYYTAKVAAGSTALPMDVAVANGKFTDLAGNPNKPSNVAVIGIDSGTPSVSIVAAQSFFNKGNSGATPSTTLTFNLSTASSDFTAEDVTIVNGGTLSAFAKSTTNDKIYTATLSGVTATTTVKVAKDAFAGTTGTAKNAESNTLGFKVDIATPTVTIDLTNAAGTSISTLKAGETAKVVFTLSEDVIGFSDKSVRVSGGYLSDFKQDTTNTKKWTATFNQAQPDPNSTAPAQVAINVDSGRFTDLAGNGNETATPKTLTADNTKPSVVSVTDNVTGTASKATSVVNYTYTFNKAVSGLEASDFTAVNGTVGNPTTTTGTSGTVWVVPVTPSADKSGNISLTLKAEGVTDSSGNKNSVHSQINQAIDTVAPTVTASIDTASFKQGTTSKGKVSFTFSEAVTGFDTSDVTVVGGAIGAITSDTAGKVWTADFTPTTTTTVTSGSILVKDGSYTDAAGNTGAASTSLALKVNTTNPTVAVTSASSSLKAGETSVLTFTFSDAVTGFDKSDVTVTGGTITDPVKSGTDPKVYTATFTPSTTASVKTATVEVTKETYVDASGAKGEAGSLSGGLKVNLSVPTLTIALESATTDGNLVYKVTGSEAFDLVSTVSPTITNGAIVSTPTASTDRTTYLMTVKPTASGDVGVSIPAGAVTNGTLTNTAAVTATTVKVALGTANVDTMTSGVGAEYVFPGAGNDILKLTATNQSTVAAPDTIAGIALGDVLDLSGLLTGYTAMKTSDATDTGAGFIEIKNMVLTNPTTSTSTVKFDITFDDSKYLNNKITGFVVDLDYDTSKVISGSVSSVTVDGVVGSDATYSPIVKNIAPVSGSTATVNGKITAPVDLSAPSTALVIDSTGKALTVTLNLSSAETSFKVGLESVASGGATVVNTSAGSNNVDVGISKTARLAGASASTVTTGQLELIQDTTTLGTVTDNQIRGVSTLSADGKSGTFKFQYDTNAAAGTTTLSDVVAINLISADSLSAFLNGANSFKVI